jgi:hypothetical protein
MNFTACHLHAGFLLGLFFDPEDGGATLLRNIGWLSTDYTALYLRIQNSTIYKSFNKFKLEITAVVSKTDNTNFRVFYNSANFRILTVPIFKVTCSIPFGFVMKSVTHSNSRPVVGSEVLTAVVMKCSIFWDITPCCTLKVNRHFGRTCRLHLQCRRISQLRSKYEAYIKQALFLRNIGWLSADYTAL